MSANTMKCILAKSFGQPDEVLYEGERPIPTVEPGSGKLLLRVQACGLTPGDYRLLLGHCESVKKPAAGFPYVPGLDVSGTVTALDVSHPKCAGFKVGDSVTATWYMQGEGGMAEYALVDAERASLRPPGISAVQGAALANSAGHAVSVVRAAEIKRGDRVMVLGGSGGVGHGVVQLVRDAGAAFVAATSTAAAMLEALGVDRVIDYRTEEWTAVPEFKKEKFDVIIDCAIGKQAWCDPGLRDVLKRGGEGGRFVAVIQNEWHIEIRHVIGILFFLAPAIWRHVSTRLFPPAPKYTMYIGDVDGQMIGEVFKLVEDGRLKIVIHEQKTFPFTEKGAKDAFNLMISRRGHGKVVMNMLEDD